MFYLNTVNSVTQFTNQFFKNVKKKKRRTKKVRTRILFSKKNFFKRKYVSYKRVYTASMLPLISITNKLTILHVKVANKSFRSLRWRKKKYKKKYKNIAQIWKKTRRIRLKRIKILFYIKLLPYTKFVNYRQQLFKLNKVRKYKIKIKFRKKKKKKTLKLKRLRVNLVRLKLKRYKKMRKLLRHTHMLRQVFKRPRPTLPIWHKAYFLAATSQLLRTFTASRKVFWDYLWVRYGKKKFLPKTLKIKIKVKRLHKRPNTRQRYEHRRLLRTANRVNEYLRKYLLKAKVNVF